MKVFICWSGKMSHQVACALRDWLPYVIQAVRPFVSSGDINKGSRWSNVVAQELNETEYGIICVTQYNMNAPWLNFEAGALSKVIDSSLVAPFLFKLNRSEITGPLSQFQSTIYDKMDIFNLLSSINNRFPVDLRIDHDLLSQELDKWWDSLAKVLDNIQETEEEDDNEFKWLYTPNALLKREAEKDVQCIWVITKDLFNHALDPKIGQVVKENVARGLKYVFIIPHFSYTEDKLDGLKYLLNNLENVVIHCIPNDQFQIQAVTDYVILNPGYDADFPMQVFFKIPTYPGRFWILVEDEAAIGFYNRFNELVKKQIFESGSEKKTLAAKSDTVNR